MEDIIDRFASSFSKLFQSHTEYKLKKLAEMNFDHLSFSQLKYLNAIYEMKGPTLSQVADYFTISRPAVTFAIEKLINMDIVSKERSDQDKRIFILKLTDEGRKIIKIYQDAHYHFLNIVKSRLNEEEFKMLVALLEKAGKV